MPEPVDVLHALLATMPPDHPDRPGITHAIKALSADDESDDPNVIMLNRPPGVGDEEWRDFVGYCRVTVTLKAAEMRARKSAR